MYIKTFAFKFISSSRSILVCSQYSITLKISFLSFILSYLNKYSILGELCRSPSECSRMLIPCPRPSATAVGKPRLLCSFMMTRCAERTPISTNPHHRSFNRLLKVCLISHTLNSTMWNSATFLSLCLQYIWK